MPAWLDFHPHLGCCWFLHTNLVAEPCLLQCSCQGLFLLWLSLTCTARYGLQIQRTIVAEKTGATAAA